MNRILLILINLLFLTLPIQLEAETLSSESRQRIENRVKEYCKLMTLFSGNIENVTLLDSIFSMCENNKVQTFDDLTPKKKSSEPEYNSYPLFQYLQNITSKYENSLDFKYSGFTCEKVVSEPQMNSTGLDNNIVSGSSILSNSYALVNVTKRIKGKGIDNTVRLRITVNISNMKIGGTVSQDYEDPYSLFLKGTSFLDEGKTEKGLELLKQSSSYKTYAGRYRAMTVMGITYFLNKNYKESERILSEASEHDPIAGMCLATIYLNTSEISSKEYFRPYVALKLLEKYAGSEDKDYPEVVACANFCLSNLYSQGKIIPKNLNKAQLHIQKMSDYIDKNFDTSLSILCFCTKAVLAEAKGDSTEIFINIKTLDNILKKTDFVNNEIERKIKPFVYWSLADIYNKRNNQAKRNEYIEKLKALGSADANAHLASIYRNDNNISEALKYYQLAADAGDGISAFIMSRYYAPQELVNYLKKSNNMDTFDKFLLEPRAMRSFYKAKHYAQISAKANDLNGIKELVSYCANGTELGGEKDLYEGLKWACVYANAASYQEGTIASQYIAYFAQQIAQNKDEELFQTVKLLADNNDPAGNYMMSLIYEYSSPCDTVKAAEYLLRSANTGFYIAMVDVASSYCRENTLDSESAIYWFKKMADMNYPAGWSGLAYCEGAFNHNYEKEKEYYLRAFEMRYPDAAISLAEYHLEGEHGFEKNPAKALYYLEQMLVFCNEQGFSPIENFYPNYEKDVARAKQELGRSTTDNMQVSDQHHLMEEYILELDTLSDLNISPDLRISQAERLLSQLFESPSVVVKTVGNNGTTVIATETANDFMMRLCTSPTKIRIVRIKSHVNDKGKFIDLTVKEVK